MSEAPPPSDPPGGLPLDSEGAAPPRERISVGLELREARIRRGRSIRQAHQATRIPPEYIEAIEAEEWDRLPAAPFTRGFVSSYSEFLGLDAADVLARIPIAPTAPGAGLQPEPPAPPPPAPQSPERAAAPPAPTPPAAAPLREELSSGFNLGPWLAAAIVALIVAAGVVAVLTLREPAGAPIEERGVAGLNEPAAPPPSAAGAGRSGDPVANLAGASLGAAIAYAASTGAPYVLIEVADAAAAGTVIDQQPPPGALLDAGDAIMIVASLGPSAADGQAGAAPEPPDGGGG